MIAGGESKLSTNEAEAPQGQSGSTTEGERRQVTALFYDIVDSTALLNLMDPEDFGVAQRRVHSVAAAAIKRHGGHLDRILGDGGCAYFGYPVPTEDAAQSAVLAALAVIEGCRALQAVPGFGPTLKIRVGVATGVVILSSMRGTGLPGEREIVGLAPTLASRLQGEAEPDSVAVAHSTYLLTQRSFEFESLGERMLKGLDEVQPVWRPLAWRAATDRFSRMRRLDTPLVAREDELGLLARRWKRAREGRGQAVFLVGEPGIGKSRLVAELRREISDVEADIRLFQCQPRGNTRPLHPFVDVLRREIGGSGDLRAPPGAAAIHDYLRRIAPDSGADAVDTLSFLFDASPLGSDQIAPIGAASNDIKQQAVQAAIEIFSAWSRARPQLIVLEDVHWADTLTEALLHRLVEEVEALPMLLVATTRNAVLPELTGDSHVLAISVSRLDPRDTAGLVEALWGPQPCPPELAAFVHERSDGVPLFVEEVTRHLMERLCGHQAVGPAEWERLLREDRVTTLQDFISARLAGLGDARRIAQIASVIGREFPYDLLARTVDGERTVISVDDALSKLLDAGLIRRREAAPRLAFRFRHVLIQDAAYQSLLKSHRRELHDRIVGLALGDLVSGTSAPELPDEIMAWHCEQAGRPLEAARYAIKAAESCAIRSVLREADQLLSTAETHLATCPPGPDVSELTLQLLATRGPVLTALHGKGAAEARAVYERGVAICQDRAHDPERWFPLYWGWWFTSPDLNVKRERSGVIIRDLDQAADPEIRLQAYHCSWASRFHAGEHRECLHAIERGLALYDPGRAVVSRARYGGHDARVCGLAERALSLWFLGQSDAAAESIEVALQAAEAADHVGTLCHALDIAVGLRRYENNWRETDVLVLRMLEFAEAHALPGLHAKAMIFGGWSLAVSGSLEQGLRRLETGLEQHRGVGTDEDLPMYLEMHAELLGRIGEDDAGLRTIGGAIEHAEQTGDVFWLAELYRRRALLRETGDRAGAVGDLQHALAVAQDQGARALADRVRADLARTGVPLP